MANLAFLIELSLRHSGTLGTFALSGFDVYTKMKGIAIIASNP
jgi:hypothetical protein